MNRGGLPSKQAMGKGACFLDQVLVFFSLKSVDNCSNSGHRNLNVSNVGPGVGGVVKVKKIFFSVWSGGVCHFWRERMVVEVLTGVPCLANF